MFSKRMILAGAVALATVGATGIALAAPAVATSPVNVRSGPGTGYAIVDSLRRGERVDVAGCRSGWCYVSTNVTDGFVSARYLTRRSGGPSVNFSINFGRFPGVGPRPPRPGFPPSPGGPWGPPGPPPGPGSWGPPGPPPGPGPWGPMPY